MKACLVDFTAKKNLVVPWMLFDSIEEAVAQRVIGHPSWPHNICEIDETNPVAHVLTRRAAASSRNSPYRSETVSAFKARGPIRPYYEIAAELGAAGPKP
ncbi:conserved hypothetical protein [Hyphomicrobiales bacterium]|jgi:hypothetical protein|nr:conserved hypothetical protein [Hyphomicrobiales bacterium]CAH1702365.1 hypothetical protein BOSEA1005_30237 [Hyphomicrobiales bacterium]CAI0346565.1 conserved hypothetical protein [Hyphomicrobiales bacterium]